MENRDVDWFERLTGFPEIGYEETRDRLEVVGRNLRSKCNGRSYAIGRLELVRLADLRARAATAQGSTGPISWETLNGEAREMHSSPDFAGAVFQVASQFNLLEMTHYDVTPESGVTGYRCDKTQGPACAIAAGAATIYRNYFVPLDGRVGQTRDRQLDGLADLGAALSESLGCTTKDLWEMRNGYALPTAEGLTEINRHLGRVDDVERDRLRDLLRIGVHWDVEVTDAPAKTRQTVTQAFCSALPVTCSEIPRSDWPPFAKLVLDAAYEATLWVGALNTRRGISNKVLLTRVGGGAFGNDSSWIDAAIKRAFVRCADTGLDVRMVHYGATARL